ncbi:Uncharacterised protein [uncultured archaeon]|nr:Uncharacterised protein [uncultured archaeon]
MLYSGDLSEVGLMNRESRPESSEETLFLKSFGIKSPTLRIIDS